MGRGGGFKGCQDEGSDDFQPATFYCYDFPTASGFFSLHVQCHLSSRRGSPQGKLIVEIIQRKKGRREEGEKKNLTKGRVVSGTQRAEMPLPITIVRKDRRQQSAAWQLNKRPIRSWHGTKIRRVCGGRALSLNCKIFRPHCVFLIFTGDTSSAV